MRLFLVAAVFPVLVAGLAGRDVSGGVARAPLDRLWEQHMLAGTSGRYSDGRVVEFETSAAYYEARGRPAGASLTNRGIQVSDLSGIRWLGLVGGAGWSLEGGLLDRAVAGDTVLELYTKYVIRWRGGWFWLDTYHDKEDKSYEFFLVKRPAEGGTGEVLRKWLVTAADIAWSKMPSAEQFPDLPMPPYHDIRAFLGYDPASTSAIVTITGLVRPFKERVHVSGAVGARR